MRRDDLPASTPKANAAWAALLDATCDPYRSAGRWAWHWARGKLRHDPVFRGMIERGDLPERARVLDIGCGQGLMASLLQATADAARRSAWPAAWPAAPSATAYTGIELMAKDVARAEAALHGLALQPRFINENMVKAPLPECDVVVILDVLHYVDHAVQETLLERVRSALLASQGRLLLRVGDGDRTRGFAVSQWVDHVVTMARGHRVPPTFGRPLAAWVKVLEGQGYTVRTVPMSQGTPFANVLLVADMGAGSR